jgi:hypothetical protein
VIILIMRLVYIDVIYQQKIKIMEKKIKIMERK